MARKKVREYDSKRLLKAHIALLAGLDLPIHVAQVKAASNYLARVSERASEERRGTSFKALPLGELRQAPLGCLPA